MADAVHMDDLDPKYRSKDVADFLTKNGWAMTYDKEPKPSKLGVRGMQLWGKGWSELCIHADGDCEYRPERNADKAYSFRLRVVRSMLIRLGEAKKV